MSSLPSKYDVSGKIVLITGAASGFGLDLAKKIAAKKPSVLISVDVQKELGEKTAAEISREFGVRTVFKRVDLSQMDEVREMVLGTVKEFGGIDVLVNVGSSYSRHGTTPACQLTSSCSSFDRTQESATPRGPAPSTRLISAMQNRILG